MILLLFSVLAQAAPPAGCRPFVEHVLRSQGIASLSAARSSCTVSDSGEDADRPFIRVAKRPPSPFTVESFPGTAAGSYQLTLNVPPMREFIYRLRVRDHACTLESVQVNGFGHRYTAAECASPRRIDGNTLTYVQEACRIGLPYYARPARSAAPRGPDTGGAGGTQTPAN